MRNTNETNYKFMTNYISQSFLSWSSFSEVVLKNRCMNPPGYILSVTFFWRLGINITYDTYHSKIYNKHYEKYETIGHTMMKNLEYH